MRADKHESGQDTGQNSRERTVSMPDKTYEYRHESLGSSPDISELVTTRLRPLEPRARTKAQQAARHMEEIRRLADLADAVEQAITALVIRLHMALDLTKREALDHNRADLQRFKDELESLQIEHQRAIERLQAQP
jgi:hypothetical protein